MHKHSHGCRYAHMQARTQTNTHLHSHAHAHAYACTHTHTHTVPSGGRCAGHRLPLGGGCDDEGVLRGDGFVRRVLLQGGANKTVNCMEFLVSKCRFAVGVEHQVSLLSRLCDFEEIVRLHRFHSDLANLQHEPKLM
jgi:hypothetical protein